MLTPALMKMISEMEAKFKNIPILTYNEFKPIQRAAFKII